MNDCNKLQYYTRGMPGSLKAPQGQCPRAQSLSESLACTAMSMFMSTTWCMHESPKTAVGALVTLLTHRS
jgi:hypothetical protein